MSKSLQFDEETIKKIEQIYSTPDVVAQRDKVLALANFTSGEKVLDIGIGPGMTTRSIAQIVGSTGSVVGTDISDSALAMAEKRCRDFSWVSLENCSADNMPFDDNSFDVAISTQVYEYLLDIDKALSELFRVLRPGGRAVILDSDWDSCVWHTHDRMRMHRVIDLYNTHCPHPFLPRTLKQRLEQIGFNLVTRDVYTIFNPDYDPNTYSYGAIEFIVAYLQDVEDIADSEVNEWAAELHELGEREEYFFSLNRYIFVVSKPA